MKIFAPVRVTFCSRDKGLHFLFAQGVENLPIKKIPGLWFGGGDGQACK